MTSIFASLVKSATHQYNSEIEEIERLLQDAASKLNDTENDALNLRPKRLILESQLNSARQTAMWSTIVSTLADTTTTICNTLLGQFGPLKKQLSQLFLSAEKIRSDALALDYRKMEFSVGLLEICRDSLIDQALIDEASMVKDEVINEYVGAVPEEVQKMASDISERMSLIATVPCIRS